MNVRVEARCMFRTLPVLAITLAWSITATSLPAQEPATSTTPADPAVSTTAATPRVVDYNNPTLEDILTAWREREEKVKNYELVWDDRCENHSPLDPRMDTNVPAERAKSPIISISKENRLIATHDSMHFKWHQAATTPLPDDAAPSFSITRMNPTGYGLFDNSTQLKMTFGRVKPPEVMANDLSMILMMPMLALYRPIWRICESPQPLSFYEQHGIAIRLLDLRDSENRLLIEFNKPPRRNRFALKCAVGFPPERLEESFEVLTDRPSTPSTIDLELEEHPIAGWVPRRWELRTTFDTNVGPRLDSVNVGTVTYARFNFDIPARTFDPTYFPKGTTVRDVRDPGGNELLYTSDGEKLVPLDVAAEEAAYSAEIESEKSRKRNPWGFVEYSLTVNAVLFFSLFGVWLWRRRSNQ